MPRYPARKTYPAIKSYKVIIKVCCHEIYLAINSNRKLSSCKIIFLYLLRPKFNFPFEDSYSKINYSK